VLQSVKIGWLEIKVSGCSNICRM